MVDASEALLSDEDRRRVLYSALLRQSRDTQQLRDKALEKLVLSALFGTSSDAPLTVGEIQRVIAGDSGLASLRVETIQQSLGRLEGRVQHTLRRRKHAYYVDESTNIDLRKQLDWLADLFSSRVWVMALGTEPLVDSVEVAEICAKFISECFGRYGRHIAETFINDVSREDLLSKVDVRTALRASTSGHSLSAEALRLIEARCVSFLRSRNPEDERLKFYVTQAYYFAQLLGLEERLLRPLTEELFAGSVFYFDTNIVIRRLLASRERPSALSEVQSVAHRLGIELRVTRATINEARRVSVARADEMRRLTAKLPDEISSLAHDDFWQAYFEAKEDSPELSVDAFFEPFDRVRELFEESGVFVDESVEEDLIHEDEVATDRVAVVIAKAAEARRGWPKKGTVLHHDVAHYRLVIQKRKVDNPRTYFLTQDGTLLDAAATLRKPDEQAFTFSVLAFLQSVSPFLGATDEEPFVDAFSRLLLDSLPPLQDTFDVGDLRVLTEIWDDVQSTPPDKIVEAYHYVRKEMSSVGTHRQLEPGGVLLGLRRFLSSSSAEQQKALREQIERERIERDRAEREAQEANDANASSAVTIASLRDTTAELQGQVDRLLLKDEDRTRSDILRDIRRARVALAIVWSFVGLMWVVKPAIARGVSVEYHLSESVVYLSLALSACCFLIGGSVLFARRAGWSNLVQGSVFAVAIAFTIVGLNLDAYPIVGVLAIALGIGGLLAGFLVREPGPSR